MKIGTFKDKSGSFIGIVSEEEDRVLPLAEAASRMGGGLAIPATMLEAIALGEQFYKEVQKVVTWVKENKQEEVLSVPMESLKILAPIPRPAKNVFCVGKNYAEHAIEM